MHFSRVKVALARAERWQVQEEKGRTCCCIAYVSDFNKRTSVSAGCGLLNVLSLSKNLLRRLFNQISPAWQLIGTKKSIERRSAWLFHATLTIRDWGRRMRKSLLRRLCQEEPRRFFIVYEPGSHTCSYRVRTGPKFKTQHKNSSLSKGRLDRIQIIFNLVCSVYRCFSYFLSNFSLHGLW